MQASTPHLSLVSRPSTKIDNTEEMAIRRQPTCEPEDATTAARKRANRKAKIFNGILYEVDGRVSEVWYSEAAAMIDAGTSGEQHVERSRAGTWAMV